MRNSRISRWFFGLIILSPLAMIFADSLTAGGKVYKEKYISEGKVLYSVYDSDTGEIEIVPRTADSVYVKSSAEERRKLLSEFRAADISRAKGPLSVETSSTPKASASEVSQDPHKREPVTLSGTGGRYYSPPTPQEYSLVEQRGLFCKIIVVSPSSRNVNDMTALGEQLRRENAHAEMMHVLVYDDERAARMFENVSGLSSSEGDFYDQHMIASYTKNEHTGCHQFAFGLDSFVTGTTTTIDY